MNNFIKQYFLLNNILITLAFIQFQNNIEIFKINCLQQFLQNSDKMDIINVNLASIIINARYFILFYFRIFH